MRINVVIDDELMAEALKSTGLSTKRAVIEEGLRTLVRLRQHRQVRPLRGKYQWEGDLNAPVGHRFGRPAHSSARRLPGRFLPRHAGAVIEKGCSNHE